MVSAEAQWLATDKTRIAESSNGRPMTWAIVVPARFNASFIESTLRNLLAQESARIGGVFVVDSDDVKLPSLPRGVKILKANDSLPSSISHVLIVFPGIVTRPDCLEQHSQLHSDRPNSIVFGRILNPGPQATVESWNELDQIPDFRDERVLSVGSRLDKLHWQAEIIDRRHFSVPIIEPDVLIKDIISGQYASYVRLAPFYGWSCVALTVNGRGQIPIKFRSKNIPQNIEHILKHVQLASHRTPAQIRPLALSHINMLISSLCRGGAERIVSDLVLALAREGVTINLFIMYDREPAYALPPLRTVRVIRLDLLSRRQKTSRIAMELLGSPNTLLFTHLVRVPDLITLWSHGILTVPVIHNSEPGWQDSPRAYSPDNVPFLVACCDSVRDQLISAGSPVPVVSIRHELQTRHQDLNDTAQVAHRIDPTGTALVVGMVGEFKRQKAYTRAVEILSHLKRVRPSRLVILGGWQLNGEDGKRSYEDFIAKVKELGLTNDVVIAGNVWPVERWLQSFDVFLNCSNFEGYSIATQEALLRNCPAVVSKVGGQAEIRSKNVFFIENPDDIESYVEAILSAADHPHELPSEQHRADANLVPSIWSLLTDVTVKNLPVAKADGVLFIINNLGRGGAQKSLSNLLTSGLIKFRAGVCIRRGNISTPLTTHLINYGVPIWAITPGSRITTQAAEVIALIERFRAKTICFWNCSPKLKMLLAKVLNTTSGIKLVDVSPGAKYFEELTSACDFGRRITLSLEQYANRLDAFIYKYPGGGPHADFPLRNGRSHLIRNGVPKVRFAALHTPSSTGGKKQPFTIGTCCRIDPVKRVHWLLEVMERAGRIDPSIRFVIVGGPSEGNRQYYEELLSRAAELKTSRIEFVGASEDPIKHLLQFDAFLMVSEPEGCPNASLEAMTVGLPVIATDCNGVKDQIQHGINGFLVSPEDPEDMVQSVLKIARDPDLAREMGVRAQEMVQLRFSMQSMAEAYTSIFKAEE